MHPIEIAFIPIEFPILFSERTAARSNSIVKTIDTLCV